MNRQELEGIVEKYQELSSRTYPHNEEKASLYERIASHLDDNIEDYIDDEYFTSEKDVVNDIKELFGEIDHFYDEEDYENMDMLD